MATEVKSSDHLQEPVYRSRDAIAPGVYAIAPMLPGTAAFGLAFGVLCAQKHFTLAEVEVMMAIVYGGPMVVVGGVVASRSRRR